MKKIIKNDTLKSNVICVLRDKVGNTFGSPSTFINEAVAVRSFGDLMSSDIYSKHKEDYELIHIGSYDLDNGIISSCSHTVLSRGVDFIER